MDLDAPCGRYLRFRDLIECGETWHRLSAAGPLDNVPKAEETFVWMRRMCERILDPLFERHPDVELTYAFASRKLTRHIPRRIAPAIDQHAGAEVGRTGKPICARGGLAVDLRVRSVDSIQVARWIADTTDFDRLYIYGPRRPLHVSVGPESNRALIRMRQLPNGRLMPRRIERVELDENREGGP